MAVISTRRRKAVFAQPKIETEYKEFGDSVTLQEKQRILEELGSPELIEAFKEWKPKRIKKRITAPLDQRVSITITNQEKAILDKEMKSLRAAGEKISASQFIRNRATSSVDINGWAEIAETELRKLIEIDKTQNDLRKRKNFLINELDETDDLEDESELQEELSEVNLKLGKLVGRIEKRNNRLTGRMSMAEAETVKWRAERLCLSVSDYLRMMIFGLLPASTADQHLSLAARQRFYIAVMDVARTGFGQPPSVLECTQCGNYLEEIERLRERNKQLEDFS